MPGSTSRWDQHEDPRDNTVDLPRIDVDGLTDYFRRAAPMLEPEPGGLLEPLPEEKRQLAAPPEPDPGLQRGSRYSWHARDYSMPGAARPEDLGHPYAEPAGPRRPLTFRTVEPPHPGAPHANDQNLGDENPTAAVGLPATPPAAAAPEVEPTPRAAPPVRQTAAAPEVEPTPRAAPPVRQTPMALEAAPTPRAAAPAEPEPPGPISEPLLTTAKAARAVPDSAEPAARPRPQRRPVVAAPGRPVAGSLADLRSRLDQLPDGHPSSPYEDDGHAKPTPVRLKQLELGLPTPTRELATDAVPDAAAADVQLDLATDSTDSGLREPAHSTGEQASAGSGKPVDSTGGQADAGSAMDDSDRAQFPSPTVSVPVVPAADEPAAESRAESGVLAGSRPAHRESADSHTRSGDGRIAPDDRTASAPEDLTLGAWEATESPGGSGLESISARQANGHGPTSRDVTTSRESLLGPDRPDRAQGDTERRDTTQREPIEPPATDLQELAERTLATCRSAEGRNAVGSYGSSGLTPAMQRLAAHLPFGGLAPGSEANSLKALGPLTAKLTRLIARNPGRTAEEIAAAIGDVVRYAFAFETADYVEGTWLVHRRLKSHGFELEIRRNRWDSPEHKGIFTQWRDPAHQISFEIQLHTTASWAVMQQTHDAYVRITDPATPPAERAQLRDRQVEAAAKITAPHNWAEFEDFRLEAR